MFVLNVSGVGEANPARCHHASGCRLAKGRPGAYHHARFAV